MNNKLVEQVVDLFKEDYPGEDLKYWIDSGRLFITSDENDLMIRDNQSYKTLVLARVSFKNQRNGYGSRLLAILEEFVKDNHYSTIIIEHGITPGIIEFAKKNEFILTNEVCYEWTKQFTNSK